MTKIVSRALTAVAAAGLVMAPIAAQAGTRADTSPVAGSNTGDGNGDHHRHRRGIAIGLLPLLLLVGAGLPAIAALNGGENHDTGRTRGG